MFLFNIKVFDFQTNNLKKKKKNKKKNNFLVNRGVATKRFFINLCFGKCEKLSFFWCPFFGQILGDVQKTL